MKLEEALIRLDEEELFGKVHSVDIEQKYNVNLDKQSCTYYNVNRN